MSIKVRKACDEDIEYVFGLVKKFVDEKLASYGFSYNEQAIWSQVCRCRDTSFVLLEDDVVIGVLAGFVTPNMVDGCMTFQEVVWYVDPEKRKYGLKLYGELEEFCREKGVKNIIMVHLGDEQGDMLEKLYMRLGFKKLETQYIKEV